MQQFFDFAVTPTYCFEGFISCDGNSAALQFAKRIADLGDADNLLYLHGPSGSGKTHLLHAIAGSISPDNRAVYLSCKNSFTVEELVSHFVDSKALIIDDIHLLSDDAGLRAGLWQLFNDFYSSGRKVALAGRYPPRELPHLDDHLVSRLLWGLVARVDASDDNSRWMILKKVSDDRQIRLPDDVVEYILMTTSREVADLISAFDKIYEMSMAEKRKISLSLARKCREVWRQKEVSFL